MLRRIGVVFFFCLIAFSANSKTVDLSVYAIGPTLACASYQDMVDILEVGDVSDDASIKKLADTIAAKVESGACVQVTQGTTSLAVITQDDVKHKDPVLKLYDKLRVFGTEPRVWYSLISTWGSLQ